MGKNVEAAFEKLATHQRRLAGTRMRDLFAADEHRFETFSARLGDLLFDYSKNLVTTDSMDLLVALAGAAGVEARRDEMFAGAIINVTEARAVLHSALRDPTSQPTLIDGVDVKADVREVLTNLGAFSNGVRAGQITSATGAPFTD
ncbi:MAG: glucose-6-phosphate isomerase, partial [Hyphomicrobiales bacterium]